MKTALAVDVTADCLNCGARAAEPGRVLCTPCEHLCRECGERPGDGYQGMCDRCESLWADGLREWEYRNAREEARARREESY